MSQLTAAQNERLRRALLAYRRRECRDSTTELARRLKRSQPSVSDVLNGKGGASYITAVRFAELVKSPVADIIGPLDAGEGEQLSTEMPDIAIGTFLLQLHARPGLFAAVTADPSRWSVRTVARALGMTFQSDSAGVPLGGWAAALDALEAGASNARPDGDIRGDTVRQIGKRPNSSPKK